jgi:hypothetical protein
MALEYRYQPREVGPPVETVTVDRHLYLTEDKTRVVEEGHPDGRSLWATPGMDVPRADAERLGAIEPAKEPPAEAVAEKAVPKPADKQRAKPADKSASVAGLRQHAADLGVQVDNRWGVERLRQEIANAQADGED